MWCKKKWHSLCVVPNSCLAILSSTERQCMASYGALSGFCTLKLLISSWCMSSKTWHVHYTTVVLAPVVINGIVGGFKMPQYQLLSVGQTKTDGFFLTCDSVGGLCVRCSKPTIVVRRKHREKIAFRQLCKILESVYRIDHYFQTSSVPC